MSERDFLTLTDEKPARSRVLPMSRAARPQTLGRLAHRRGGAGWHAAPRSL